MVNSEYAHRPRQVCRLEVVPFAIPLRAAFVTATSVAQRRVGFLVRAYDEEGRVGVGEVALLPDAPAAALRRAWQELQALATGLAEGSTDVSREAAWQRRLLALSTAAVRAGVEAARHDLWAQGGGVSLGALLGGEVRSAVSVNATLADAAPSRLAEQAEVLVTSGFRCLKLKVGQAGIAVEAAKLAAIRKAVGDAVAIRLDVNAVWSVPQAIDAIAVLAPFGIDYVEQPVAGIEALAAVRAAVGVRIAADESVRDVASVTAIAARGAADVIVIKPSVHGLRTSLALMREAYLRQLPVVVTSVIETSIGIAAALQVAAVAPGRLLPCGLATATLLDGDLVAEGELTIAGGMMRVPTTPGLGVAVDAAALQRWRIETL